VKERRALLWLAAFFGLLLAATCVHRQVWVDEPWFGEQAATLAREGRVRSELFRGLGAVALFGACAAAVAALAHPAAEPRGAHGGGEEPRGAGASAGAVGPADRPDGLLLRGRAALPADGLHRFDHHDRRTGRFPGFDGLFEIARAESVDAVILDRVEARGFQYLHLTEPLPEAMPGYALSADDGRFAVYELVHVAVPAAPRRSPPPSLRRPTLNGR